MARRSAFVLLFVCLLAASLGAQTGPWWVIGHMSNTPDAVNWAASVGANGIEADLRFDGDGNPTVFRHGSPCDCSCLITYGVCRHLGPVPCEATTDAVALLATVARNPSLGLVVIDSKVDTSTNPAAGTKVVSLLESALFGNGFGGVVIIGSPTINTLFYLRAAADAAKSSPHGSRMYFTIDGETTDTVGVLKNLVTLPTPRIVYGTGISACSPAQYYQQTLIGAFNERAGVIGLNYIWTIDKSSTAYWYLAKGATGLMTNSPDDMVSLFRSSGFRLATAGSSFPPATSTNIISSVPGCDCDYHPGGCRISYAPPVNWACNCQYKGAWTCGGDVVMCQDPNNPNCKNPTTSFDTCVQGRGDCQGYKDYECDCDYHPGGCSISKVAPPNTACRCVYKGAWTCGGNIVPCADPNSAACKSPSTDKASCQQGQGDCGAYK